MIEREFIKEKVKYLKAKEYIIKVIPKSAGIGKITIEKTPLGEKVTVDTVKPGLVIGRGGKTISDLTTTLKTKFAMENPQIEVREIVNPNLSAGVIANRIASDLEKFGPARFKAIGYRALTDIMRAGALGTEIKIGGRGVPGQRAQSWRFPAGYMKKCGNIAMEFVDIAIVPANLHSGTVGVQVMIMPPTIDLPDRIKIKEGVTPTSAVEDRKTAAAQKPVAVIAEASIEIKEKKPKTPRKKKTETADKSAEKIEEKNANTPS